MCRIGGTLTLDDLAETEIGDWKMPDFRLACSYAASQGWLIVEDDVLTLTTAGLGRLTIGRWTRFDWQAEPIRAPAGGHTVQAEAPYDPRYPSAAHERG